MATKLVNLKIIHVAGVDKPANKRSFLIIKQEKVDKQMSIAKEGDKFCLYDGDKKLGEYATQADAETAKEKMMTKGATMLSKEMIAKISDKDIQEAVVAQAEEVVSLQKKQKDLEQEIEKLKVAPPTDEEEIWKNVPPAIRNRFEAMEKEKKDAEKRAEDERDAREINSWVEKSKAFTYLQIVPQQFGKVMKNIAKACPDDAREIERILGVAQDTIAKGAVFTELGRNNGGSRAYDATNVSARVEALAEDYMQMDSKLTKEAAISKVFRENPEWHKQYRREQSVKV